MKPKVRTVEGLLHLRYNLPLIVHTAKVYPCASENGSSIILCGHERGLAVTWRGGRPFKAGQDDSNGHDDHDADEEDEDMEEQDDTQDAMAVDSAENESDEEVNEMTDSEFENDDVQFDPAHPYRNVMQHKNLDLGTAVLHIAFPRLPQKKFQHYESVTPGLLDDNMLVAIACADSTIRLLALPLKPVNSNAIDEEESEEDFSSWFYERANWIDGMVTVPSAKGHRSLPRGISIALTTRPMSSIEGAVEVTESSDGERPTEEWDVLVASHSSDLSGRLLIHRIPISNDGWHIEAPPQDEILWRSERLCSPAASVQLYVPPSAKEEQSIPRVLVAEAGGSVRVYECETPAGDDRGAWSIALHAGYSNELAQSRRILDAQWVLGGSAICILTADGEWGVWDLSASHVARTIAGSALTKFALSGWITSPAATIPKAISTTSRLDSSSSLAPMTPNARKVRQDALFGRSPVPLNSAKISNGGIIPQLTVQSETGHDDDENLTIWHGDRTVFIGSLRAHYRAQLKATADPFSGGPSAQVRELAAVDVPGEQRVSVATFSAEGDTTSSALRVRPVDLLVAGNTGFTIVTAPLQQPTKPEPAPAARRKQVTSSDGALLAQGQLDLDGMDRMLDGMAAGSQDAGDLVTKGYGTKSVGFAA